MSPTKKFVLKLFACIAIILTLDVLVGATMNYALGHLKNGNTYEWEYKLFGAKPAIAILGSSRAYYHYNTGIIQNETGLKTINYGQIRSNVFFDYIVLKTIIKYHLPQTVIVDVRPGEFEAIPDFNQINSLYPLIDKLPITQTDLAEISPVENIKLLLNTYRFNNQFFEILSQNFGQKEAPSAITGFNALAVNNTTIKMETINNSGFDENLVRYFNAIISLCKTNNIRLVICTSPYYANLLQDRSLEEIKKITAANNIPFINYITTPLTNNGPGLYSDALHLNAIGADLFTKDLLQRIKF